ncbi:MAG: hypothetical protein HKL86_07785 [Acidimicrobiaceae bacterium]|nr:hypothetical protein [Acidimicrobiaceae bacterium]
MVRSKTAGVILAILIALSGVFVPLSMSQAASPSVIRVAEAPGANPNYIFPYMQCAYFSTSNINQFQRLMYRPLYWFGLGRSTALVPSLSIANSPVFNKSDTSLSLSTKGWRFHGGQAVNARSVMFFLNLWVSDPTNFCAYEPNHGIPDEIKSATAQGNVVRINFTAPVNPQWIVDNFLSLVTPMPEIWDRTSTSAKAGCSSGRLRAASTVRACKAVDAYLQARASNTATFASPFWQAGTDGPWLLSSFSSAGDATFVPNSRYSGTPKPGVAQLKEIAYQSTSDVVHDLISGKVDLAYLSYGAITSTASTPSANAATMSGIEKVYNLASSNPWAIDYFPFNFNPADPKAAIVAQPYIRQAMQYAIDQSTIVKNIYGGYAVAGTGPLPNGISTQVGGKVSTPFSYSLSAAQNLLTAHGWALQSGVMTCVKPGAGTSACGNGVASGATLSLKLIATSDSAQLNQIIALEIAAWHSIGIEVTLQSDTYASVLTDCGSSAGYELCAWSGGWNYLPSIYPSGEDLFTTAGTFDVGGYNDSTLTKLINASLHTKANLAAYSRFIVAQAPVLVQPSETLLAETRKTLRSSIPIVANPLNAFTPEYYHY